MSACIVCNQLIKSKDLQDVGNMAELRARLENVLDEAVPLGSVMCSSCQSDLAEIEMYYALLTVFKKRYSETAKQRCQVKESQNDETSRNLLHDAADCSSQHLQNMFAAGNSLQTSNTTISGIFDAKNSPVVVKHDILGLGLVKEEFPTNEAISASRSPSEHVGIQQSKSSTTKQAETVGNSSDECEATTWGSDIDESKIDASIIRESQEVGLTFDISAAVNSGEIVKRRGRPRNSPESILFPIWTAGKAARKERKYDMASSPRKSGRPIKGIQPSALASAISLEVSATAVRKHCRKNTTLTVSQQSLATERMRCRPTAGISPDLVQTDSKRYGRQRNSQQQSVGFDEDPMKIRPIRKDKPVSYADSESGGSSLGEQINDELDANDNSSYDESDLKPLMAIKGRQKRKERPVYYEEPESGEGSLGDGGSHESDEDDSSYDESDLEPLKRASSSPSITLPSSRSGTFFKEEGMAGNAADLSAVDSVLKTQDTTVNRGPLVKKKLAKPKEDEDPSYDPDAVMPVRRKRAVRPKKIDEGPFPCTECEKVFISRQRLRVHMRSHSDVRPHVCTVCGKAFKTYGTLKAHTNIHDGTKPFVCETCGRAFLMKADLEKHLFLHNDDYPYPCDQCDKRFKSPVYLKAHVKLHHVEGRKFLCSICGAASFTKHSLKTHMTTHSEKVKEKPWRCDTCGKYFATKKTCQIHEVTHNPETREKYLCPICGKELLQKQYLKLHMKQHTGDTNISCSMCDATFTAPVHYRRHMTIHSGERPYKCRICGNSFRLANTLKQHMMSHTDERPFSCSCGQGFRQKVKLQRHMRRTGHPELDAKSRPLNVASEKPAEIPAV